MAPSPPTKADLSTVSDLPYVPWRFNPQVSVTYSISILSFGRCRTRILSQGSYSLSWNAPDKYLMHWRDGSVPTWPLMRSRLYVCYVVFGSLLVHGVTTCGLQPVGSG